MNKLIQDFAPWFAKCAILGSIPGALCWVIYWNLGGFIGV